MRPVTLPLFSPLAFRPDWPWFVGLISPQRHSFRLCRLDHQERFFPPQILCRRFGGPPPSIHPLPSKLDPNPASVAPYRKAWLFWTRSKGDSSPVLLDPSLNNARRGPFRLAFSLFCTLAINLTPTPPMPILIRLIAFYPPFFLPPVRPGPPSWQHSYTPSVPPFFIPFPVLPTVAYLTVPFFWKFPTAHLSASRTEQ